MIPVINGQGETEFNLVLGRKILRCCLHLLKAMKDGMRSIRIYERNSTDYPAVQKFIETIFKNYYGAEISVGMPQLMAVVGKDQKVISAVGMRCAGSGRLFLEQYLDEPIEKIIHQITGEKITRNEIIEIGSLASGKKDAAKFLYVSLATYLKTKGYKYAVMTGTAYLQTYFKKAGLHPKIITDAKQSRLENQTVNWGSYYNNDPKVMMMDVEKGQQVLGGILGIIALPNMTKLYPHLRYD